MPEKDNRYAWQQRALESYFKSNSQDWLLSATPGAGKTRFAASIARILLDRGIARRIIVVVPSDALREQWPVGAMHSYDDSRGVELCSARDLLNDSDKPGYDGIVVTYQQVATNGKSLWFRKLCSVPTLVIFDEIHHAGDAHSWGAALREAFEPAFRRLCLTGTPWRRDNNPIPFVRYDKNNTVESDYAYEYGTAVSEGACRQITFHAFDGEAKWVECGQVVESKLGADMEDTEAGVVLGYLYDQKGRWIPSLLEQAHHELESLRVSVPDAAGLIVAEYQDVARAYADILTRITGTAPTLVLSEDIDAKAKLDAFGAPGARGSWLVAVRMVSEGIDIPRLSVCVYAARWRTPLFFRQIVGRIVRRRESDEHGATMFIPKDYKLCKFAAEIEDELRHMLEEERAKYEKEMVEREKQCELPMRFLLETTDATHGMTINGGESFMPDEIERARGVCRTVGFSDNDAAKMARALRLVAVAHVPESAANAAPDQPRIKRERLLRTEITGLVGKIAFREFGGGHHAEKVNERIRIKCNLPARPKCSVEQLERAKTFCVDWLKALSC